MKILTICSLILLASCSNSNVFAEKQDLYSFPAEAEKIPKNVANLLRQLSANKTKVFECKNKPKWNLMVATLEEAVSGLPSTKDRRVDLPILVDVNKGPPRAFIASEDEAKQNKDSISLQIKDASILKVLSLVGEAAGFRFGIRDDETFVFGRSSNMELNFRTYYIVYDRTDADKEIFRITRGYPTP
jgi:hypothetical protein